ncbi:Uncharacterized protein SCF082_LOCUS4240 [Durusdinium trenchii]|uniref:Uncharacterized protein n=1 Tax=Durusdinium trenchii TaxID=1381693 RepID=A0ABP0HYA5_9DINO
MKLLVAGGADVNAEVNEKSPKTSKGGWTARDVAWYNGNKEADKYLTEHGGKRNAKFNAAWQEVTAAPKKKTMTARTVGRSSAWTWTKSNLSYVKQHRPELFKAKGGDEAQDAVPGFKPYGEEREQLRLVKEGWLHNPDTGVFLEPGGQKLWFDPEATVVFWGSRHLFIPDLHRTAQALKADLGHLDRPAALLALLDAASAPPHERLIRRLAACRSEWSMEALWKGMKGRAPHAQAQSIALALVVGQRAFAAAFRGARCWRFGELGPSEGHGVTKADFMKCEVLCHDFEKSGAAYVVLSMGDLGLKASEIREVVLPHLTQARPRAASLSLRQAAQGVGIGCMRLAASGGPAGPATSVPGQPAKRQRVVGVDAREVPGRVRIRQILLRAWRGGTAPKPEEPTDWESLTGE